MHTLPDPIIYIPVVMPEADGSGTPRILGAFTEKVEAEARSYRETLKLGYPIEIRIFNFVLNDTEGE